MRSFFASLKKKKDLNGNHSDSRFDVEQKHILSLRARTIPTFTQMRYIPQYLTDGERFLVRIMLLALVASLLVIGIRWWQNSIVWTPKEGGAYTEGLVGFPRFINPVLTIGSNTDSDLASALFPGLVKIDGNDTVVPDLAESYEISEDSKTYTFVMRENLKWDDGEPLTIDDVLFTFQLIQDSSYGSPWGYTFRDVTFERVDDRTLKATLKNPSILYIRYLTIGILPQHRFLDIIPANFALTEDNLRPTGAGPYKFDSLIRSRSGEIRSMTLVRNDLYHGERPFLDELRFRFYPDITSALEALKNREIQGTPFVPPWYADETATIKNIDKDKHLIVPQVTALFFNLKNDLFDKKDFRRALILATDREQIIREVTNGHALISEGPFAPGFIGFAPDLAPRPRIQAEAEQLLDSVGFKRGEDGMRKRGDGNLRLVITTIDQEPYPQIAEIIKSNWQDLGIEVEIQLADPGRLSQDVLKPRRYDLLLYSELFDETLDPYAFWHSSQSLDPGLNFSTFINKKADALLEDSRTEWSREKRTANYQEVQRIIADEIPAIFLYTPIYDYLTRDNIKNVTTGNLAKPHDRFNFISSWYKETTPVLKNSLENEE